MTIIDSFMIFLMGISVCILIMVKAKHELNTPRTTK